jgi:KUP system potassium uptake protein
MGVEIRLPTTGKEDNQACVEMVKNPVGNPKLKHVLTKYHFVKDCVEAGKVKFVYCASNDNIADIFTKPIGEKSFVLHRAALGLASSSGSVEM